MEKKGLMLIIPDRAYTSLNTVSKLNKFVSYIEIKKLTGINVNFFIGAIY
jgi:hypothetical protein